MTGLQDLQDCAHTPTFRGFRVFRGKKGLEAGGGTAASPSTQGREAAAPPAHANLGAMVLATKNTKSAFFSAFSAISAVKNNAAEVFVFNRKERKERKEPRQHQFQISNFKFPVSLSHRATEPTEPFRGKVQRGLGCPQPQLLTTLYSPLTKFSGRPLY